MLNYYEILEVEVDSTTAEIKAAYRKLARKYHPDLNKEAGAIDKFKMVTLAYETLSNEQEREKYNILKGIFKKTYNEKTTTSAEKASEEYQNTANTHKETQKTEDKNDYSQKPNTKTAEKNTKSAVKKREFNLLKTLKYFAAKFKKNKRAQDSKKPQKGQNITTEVIITPEEVIAGSKRVINVLTTQTCSVCMGHRFINGGKCPECNGSGEVSKCKKITVTIPKGIKDGAKLRLKNEGGTG